MAPVKRFPYALLCACTSLVTHRPIIKTIIDKSHIQSYLPQLAQPEHLSVLDEVERAFLTEFDYVREARLI